MTARACLLALALTGCASGPCDCTQHGDKYPDKTTEGQPIYSEQVEVICKEPKK